MSDGLSVHCVDTTDVVAVDTAHTKDVLSADATDFMSAHTTLTFPRKSKHSGPRTFDPTFTMLLVTIRTAMPLFLISRQVSGTEFQGGSF